MPGATGWGPWARGQVSVGSGSERMGQDQGPQSEARLMNPLSASPYPAPSLHRQLRLALGLGSKQLSIPCYASSKAPNP